MVAFNAILAGNARYYALAGAIVLLMSIWNHFHPVYCAGFISGVIITLLIQISGGLYFIYLKLPIYGQSYENITLTLCKLAIFQSVNLILAKPEPPNKAILEVQSSHQANFYESHGPQSNLIIPKFENKLHNIADHIKNSKSATPQSPTSPDTTFLHKPLSEHEQSSPKLKGVANKALGKSGFSKQGTIKNLILGKLRRTNSQKEIVESSENKHYKKELSTLR